MANNNSVSSDDTTVVKKCEVNGVLLSNADILANLCVDAEVISTDIRDCIRLYNDKFTTTQLTALFAQTSKDILVQTLNFLGATTSVPQKTWNDYVKPTCIRELIVRIQNLLIDTCGFCKNNYACQRTDRCYLKCCYCGQFAHQQCLENILGEHFNANMTESEIQNIIFPFQLNCYYFCHECSDKRVPQNTTGLKKVHSKILSSPDSQISLNLNKHSDASQHTDTADVNIVNVPNSDEKHDEELGDSPVKRSTVCHFYRKGICKHGKSGENCKFAHPPYCKSLLRFGKDHPKGCNKGSSCQFFHPKMCYMSMAKHQCYNVKCQYFHVKNTKRVASNSFSHPRYKRDVQGSFVTSAKPNYTDVENTSSNASHHGNLVNNHKVSDQHFLGLFQQMKSDLLQSIEHKFAMMSNTVNRGHANPCHYLQNSQQQQYQPPDQTSSHNMWMSQPQEFPHLS